MEEQQKILDELSGDLGLEIPDVFSRQEILHHIEAALSQLVTKEPERFFQLMYRLDIAEEKLRLAMNDSVHGLAEVAELIYERQLLKIRSRRHYRSEDKPDAELDW